jgi:hypothetical protein
MQKGQTPRFHVTHYCMGSANTLAWSFVLPSCSLSRAFLTRLLSLPTTHMPAPPHRGDHGLLLVLWHPDKGKKR